VPCQYADVTRNSLFYVYGVYIKGLLAVSRLARARRACTPPLFFIFGFFFLFCSDLSLFYLIVLATAEVPSFVHYAEQLDVFRILWCRISSYPTIFLVPPWPVFAPFKRV